MEPVSAHFPTPPALRPALSLPADLMAVLQEGRVLAGEVLQSFGGNSVLIGIGDLRVLARRARSSSPPVTDFCSRSPNAAAGPSCWSSTMAMERATRPS